MKSKKANNAEKLLEATMLALQGKLELKENKVAESRVRTKSRAKKNESIDVNVDEKTNVSVEGNETVVDTEDATVVINKKDNFVPETSDGIIDTDLPSVESPAEDLPVETPDTVMPEEVTDEPVDTELPEDEEEKEPSIDEMIGESKKVESSVRDAAIELNQKDRDSGQELATMTGMIATRIADIAEELGDDYSEWLSTDDVRQIADEIVTSKMWTDFNTQLDDFIREMVEDRVAMIRSDDPASKYYTGDLDESKKLEEDINHNDLVQAGTDLWGDGAVVNDTIVDGIYDCYTDGHGGYLIDTDIFPQLKKYGEETSIDNIVGFEEDYEALKILWVFPMLINNEDFKNKLNLDMVLRYEDNLNDDFRKEFPTIGGSIEVIEENKKVDNEEKDNIKLENRKLNENIEIEISEDGKEVEVKTDNGEEVEVKDETPDEEEVENEESEDTETEIPEDEIMEENKKVLGKYIKENINRKKLKENKYSDSTWYEYDVDGTRFNFFCRSWSTSRSWGHEVELKDGYRTIGNARCTYYNRTWESFEYQTCMLKAISDAEKNGYDKEKLDKLAEQVKTGKGLTENKEQCEDCKNGTCECKKTESNETPKMDTNDLGINEGVPKKEEPVPNTDTKIEEKFSSKTFEKALTEFLKREVKDIDNVKVEKIIKSSKGLKIEATILRNTLTKPKKVTLEMLNIQKGSSFNKYKLKESKSIIVENKKESSEITMLTFKNKQNILECRYFTKNK